MKQIDDYIIQPDYDFEPYCVLEGGSGFIDMEQDIIDRCNHKHITCWAIDDLYDNPERIKAIKYLKPKTIILGTTGTYVDKLSKIIEFFSKLNYFPDNVIFTMGEDYFYGLMKKAKIKNPKIKFYKMYPSFGENIQILIREIDNN